MLYPVKKYYLLFALCLSVSVVLGQKANYRLAERFRENNAKGLVGTTKVVPVYLTGSDAFWYSYRTSDGIRYYFVDPKAKIHRELFDREYLAGEVSKAIGKPVDYKNMSITPLFQENGRVFTFFTGNRLFFYDTRIREVVKVRTPPSEPVKKNGKPFNKKTFINGTYSPDSAHVVYAKEFNLYLFSLRDSVETRLTTDGEEGYSYAKIDAGNRKMHGRVRWFEDSRSFVAERTDRRKKPGSMYLVNSLESGRPTLKTYDYVMPGDEFVPREELHLFNVSDKKQVKVAVEKWKDQTLQLFSVGKKGEVKRFYFLRKRRTCDEIDFCRVDSRTGEVKVLFNEVSKPYFNDEWFYLSLLNDGEDILWWSERTGCGHLYHYDGEGKLKNAVTSGDFTTGKVLKIDTLRRVVYFTGYGQVKGESPYYARVNKARLDGDGKVEVLTPEEATHEVCFSASGRYFVDNYSRADLEPRSVLRDNTGKVILELASPDLSRLYATGWKMPEAFTVKAADGVTDLYGFMWKPFDFDSTKSYPLISYVYPGPQMDCVPLEFTVSDHFNVPLAQVGFVVVVFGHRGGTPLRERWYHTYGYGNLRDYPLADNKCGIEQLADRYPFVDVLRVGIYGHSGGGFMSTAAICTYPDFYKAAISSSGNHDNRIYNRWWGETHHGMKEVSVPEKKTVKNVVTGKDSVVMTEKVGFEFKVPTNMELAKNLKGHLMLVHGDADNNVHPVHTLRMADALLQAGKNFELVLLPGQGHVYHGKQRDFYEMKMWFHFAKYLLGDFSCEGF